MSKVETAAKWEWDREGRITCDGKPVRVHQRAFETRYTLNPPARYAAQLDEAREATAYIIECVNSHDALAAENAALREALTAYISTVNEALTDKGCADIAKWDADGSAPGVVGKLMDCESQARKVLGGVK